jgi:hypothetical protein
MVNFFVLVKFRKTACQQHGIRTYWFIGGLKTLLRFQMFLSPTNLLHPIIFISNKESLQMSSHLSRGLSTGLIPRNFPFSIFFGILASPILTLWWAYCDVLNFIHFPPSGQSNNSYRFFLYLIADADDDLKYSVLSWSAPTLQKRILRDRHKMPQAKVEECVDNEEDVMEK